MMQDLPDAAFPLTDLLILGGGNMGEALLGGLLRSGVVLGERVTVVEPASGRRAQLTSSFPGVRCVAEVTELTDSFSGVLVAVKPQYVAVALIAARPRLSPGARILSIAAGVTTAAMESVVGSGFAVVRAMPNTPALVGQGVSGVAGGSSAGPSDIEWAITVLSAVGVARQFTEVQLDAVTGLSGSGPAYLFLVAEALTEAGVFVGLSRDDAAILTAQTLLGAATLLSESPLDAGTLRANVTSPGGTTAAGLRALEDKGIRSAFIDAVAAATQRATELRG